MKLHNFFLSLALAGAAASSAWFMASAQQTAPATGAADNEYQVGAVLYMQKAAEYRALAYQAFNLARWQLDADLDKKNEKKLTKAERRKRRAVVVDIDETVLDNSPAQARGIRDRKPFNQQDWYAWGEMRKAKAIPASVDLLNYAVSKGVRVFYVSNRDDVQLQATMDNLKNVGFRDISAENVLLRVGGVSGKEPRRNRISTNHRIVLLMGDNLDDFSDVFERKSVIDRFAEVDRFRNDWGRRWIVLPNAMYGTWESAIYSYGRLSEGEKTRARSNALELP